MEKVNMVFSLNNLGLSSGSYGEDYNIVRGNCFHSGKDYTTNQTPTQFTAGVFGKVVNPIGGEWGTIGVIPFGVQDLIQYLHCSEISVNAGDVVAPWTVLGRTGDVCPPGGCNGIHLHLHVVRPTGTPSHDCWTRNFVDPNTWSYPNPLRGTWETNYQWNGTPGSNVRLHEMSIRLVISSDLLATVNYSIALWIIHVQTALGRTCTINVTIRNRILFSSYTNNGINFEYLPDGYSVTTTPGTGICNNISITQSSMSGRMLLDRHNSLFTSGPWDGNRRFSKSAFVVDPMAALNPSDFKESDNPDLILDISRFQVHEPKNGLLLGVY